MCYNWHSHCSVLAGPMMRASASLNFFIFFEEILMGSLTKRKWEGGSFALCLRYPGDLPTS